MIRTQVQLPDELYRQAVRLARAREWSLAEVIRRGLETLLATRNLRDFQGFGFERVWDPLAEGAGPW